MLQQPEITPVSEKLYRLDADYTYVYRKNDRSISITVPKGTLSDLASVPRILWAIIPRDGLASGPAEIHDWLYKNKGLIVRPLQPNIILSRAECDEVLLQALLDAGCTPAKAYTMYYAVRSFGWISGGLDW